MAWLPPLGRKSCCPEAKIFWLESPEVDVHFDHPWMENGLGKTYDGNQKAHRIQTVSVNIIKQFNFL